MSSQRIIFHNLMVRSSWFMKRIYSRICYTIIFESFFHLSKKYEWLMKIILLKCMIISFRNRYILLWWPGIFRRWLVLIYIVFLDEIELWSLWWIFFIDERSFIHFYALGMHTIPRKTDKRRFLSIIRNKITVLCKTNCLTSFW